MIQDQGSVVNESDAVGAWNAWVTGSPLGTGAGDCGNESCVIYTTESVNCGSDPDCYNGGAGDPTTLSWTDCTMPELTANPLDHYASTYYIVGNSTNLPDSTDCAGLAQYQNVPVYVVVVQQYSYSTDARMHIARHELGHALGLGHYNDSCWRDGAGLWEPLMKPGHCSFSGQGSGWPDFSGFPVTASPNEVSAVESQQGW